MDGRRHYARGDLVRARERFSELASRGAATHHRPAQDRGSAWLAQLHGSGA